MSGLFEHISKFDEQAQIAQRQAVAVAHKRFNDRFASFLKNASSDSEFNSRLALVDEDLKAMVADVASEYEGDSHKIEAALKSAISATRVASCDCDGNCEGDCKCGGCDGCNCKGKKMSKDHHPEDDDRPKRPEHLKAQDEEQDAAQHSKVPPWLKKQDDDEDQEDGGNRKSKTAMLPNSPTDPASHVDGPFPDLNAMQVGTGPDNYLARGSQGKQVSALQDKLNITSDGDFGPETLNAVKNFQTQNGLKPDGVVGEATWGKLVGDMGPGVSNKAEGYNLPSGPMNAIPGKTPGFGATSAAHKVEQKDGEFFVIEDDDEKAAGPFDSREEAEARADKLNGLENLETEETHKKSSITPAMARAQEMMAKQAAPLLQGFDFGDIGKAIENGFSSDTTTPADVAYNNSLAQQAQAELAKKYPGMDTSQLSTQDITNLYDNPAKYGPDKGFKTEPAAKTPPAAPAVSTPASPAASAAPAGGQFTGLGQYGPYISQATPNAPASEIARIQKSVGATADGIYGPETAKAVANFQKQHGLNVDGVIGAQTEAALQGNKGAASIDPGAMTFGGKRSSIYEGSKPETGDTHEERVKLPKGNEDAHNGPSPKIDKKKWVPNATNPEGNLKPIETEGEHSPTPTHKQDIKQKPDYENEDEWQHDNKTWKREQLPSSDDDDSSGFERTKNLKDQPTKAAETWHGMNGQTKPVTKKSLPEALAEKTVSSVRESAWWDASSPFVHWLMEKGDPEAIKFADAIQVLGDDAKHIPAIEELWNEFTASEHHPESAGEMEDMPEAQAPEAADSAASRLLEGLE